MHVLTRILETLFNKINYKKKSKNKSFVFQTKKTTRVLLRTSFAYTCAHSDSNSLTAQEIQHADSLPVIFELDSKSKQESLSRIPNETNTNKESTNVNWLCVCVYVVIQLSIYAKLVDVIRHVLFFFLHIRLYK